MLMSCQETQHGDSQVAMIGQVQNRLLMEALLHARFGVNLAKFITAKKAHVCHQGLRGNDPSVMTLQLNHPRFTMNMHTATSRRRRWACSSLYSIYLASIVAVLTTIGATEQVKQDSPCQFYITFAA